MATPQKQVETIVISNWGRKPLTIFQNGELDSGSPYLQTSGGYNPFLWPGTLSWASPVQQIDEAGAVITDLILAGKTRVESGVTYVYAIGNTGRLYKIQVNDPTTFNPDYDNPVLLATLTINTPTFTRGAFIDFYGSTERIYIGHDVGVTQIDFDGTNEAFVGVVGSWTQNVPRPLRQFVGNLYVGNGSNIAEIGSTLIVNSYTKLNPGFPANSQVRDLDVSPEGTYLQAVVNRAPLPDITSTTQDTTSNTQSESYLFKWNGTDAGYTTFFTYPGLSLTANILFQQYQYLFGNDQSGVAVLNPLDRIIFGPELVPVLPNSIASLGSMLMFISPLIFDTTLEADVFTWGAFSYEQGVPYGYDDIGFFNASGAETDVKLTPMFLPVSNIGFGTSSNGYTGSQYSSSKMYISALETSSSTSVPKLYKWKPSLTPIDTDNSATIDAIYQTQTQLFSEKITIKEVRIYAQPWVLNNSFTVNLIGSSGEAMTNGSKTFTAQNSDASAPMYVGTDYAWWNPQVAPTYALGISVVNAGTVNHVINKIEIDYTIGGK